LRRFQNCATWASQNANCAIPKLSVGGLSQETPVEWQDHTHQVGCIVTNLQSLETILRYFLLRVHGQQVQFPKVGDVTAAKTYLTNYMSLGQLVDEFNNALTQAESEFKVDREVVVIRDSVAHGRLLTEKELPYRLWKFGKKINGRVTIDFCEELTLDWLKVKSQMIFGEKEKVMACFKGRRYQGLQ
jgi:hypothetical protein